MPEGASVLDAGCGTGTTANYIRTTYAANVIGIDCTPENVQKNPTYWNTSRYRYNRAIAVS